MIKLAYFLAFASGSSFCIYGQRGKMLGRTQANKFLKRQVLRMPDDQAKRDDWTKQVFMAFDQGNPPMPHILAEDTDQDIGSEKRFGPIDLSHAQFIPVPVNAEDGVRVDANKVNEGPDSDPDITVTTVTPSATSTASIVAMIADTIKSNGKLKANHLAEILDESRLTIALALRNAGDAFVIDQEGWVDLAQPPKHPKKKKTAHKAKKKSAKK